VKRPFVIAVASEKGGVGKTTIATNLAVYLKALREDLPVTIASFDNHFSVDQMFALGPHPEGRVANLIEGCPVEELAVLGEYGVQYVASSRRLQAPDHDSAWLRQRLLASTLDGILILDTRPILDWFTEAALLSADLVIVPIKDRAALINAGSLRQIMADAGRVEKLWLLPSLVDTRARLNAEVRVHELLIYGARERDYQVLDICISKSPKVEGLASGFSSRIRPVLTHARNTAVHGQFKKLAEFVLSNFAAEIFENKNHGYGERNLERLPVARRRKLILECPLCCQSSLHADGHFFFDLSSRRRGFIHPDCCDRIFAEFELDMAKPEEMLALTIEGPGLVGPEARMTAHLFDAEESLVVSEELDSEKNHLSEGLSMMMGRTIDAAYRELVLVNRKAGSPAEQLDDDLYRHFAFRRRRIARELRLAGLF
jgi:cellulose biosynthesis protein BcsQ